MLNGFVILFLTSSAAHYTTQSHQTIELCKLAAEEDKNKMTKPFGILNDKTLFLFFVQLPTISFQGLKNIFYDGVGDKNHYKRN